MRRRDEVSSSLAADGKTCDEISFHDGDGATRGGVKDGLRRKDARGGVLL